MEVCRVCGSKWRLWRVIDGSPKGFRFDLLCQGCHELYDDPETIRIPLDPAMVIKTREDLERTP